MILSSLGFADDPTFMTKGTVLPSDAWVFSPEKAKTVRDGLIDRDTYFQLNQSLNKSIDLYKDNEVIQQTKINLCLEQNDKLVKTSSSLQTVNTIEKIGYFVLGVAAVVFGGWALGQVHK